MIIMKIKEKKFAMAGRMREREREGGEEGVGGICDEDSVGWIMDFLWENVVGCVILETMASLHSGD